MIATESDNKLDEIKLLNSLIDISNNSIYVVTRMSRKVMDCGGDVKGGIRDTDRCEFQEYLLEMEHKVLNWHKESDTSKPRVNNNALWDNLNCLIVTLNQIFPMATNVPVNLIIGQLEEFKLSVKEHEEINGFSF